MLKNKARLFICAFLLLLHSKYKSMRKFGFTWILTALCAVCLAVVINWQEQEGSSEEDLSERSKPSVVTSQREQPHEATLTDASELYRICSSRPQRVLPTQGPRSKRTLTPSFNVVRQRIITQLHSYYDSRCRLESSPFCLSASCDYYVIALRHIIR